MFQNMIDFPVGLSEEVRIQVCKMLDKKDKEIKSLYKDIIALENKIERFNGGLTYKESEALKTIVAINNGILEQVRGGLKNFNLRYVEYSDPKSPHAFPVKIERVTIFERLGNWFKFLFNFKIVRNNN